MELIQPFLNSADAVLAQGLESAVSIDNLTMDEQAYRRKGIAAEVSLSGDIEGRIIIDADEKTATSFASRLAGTDLASTDDLVREAVCELANQIIGNAVTVLNDQGFHFRVHPPTIHTSEQGSKSSEDTEAVVLCFSTERGKVYMNVALRYHHCSLEQAAAGR
ncbi:MAG: chemotaxis protein CheX [Terriglobales bacterium]